MIGMGIKAVYKKEVLKPSKKLDLKEGEEEEEEIELKKSITESTFGVI